MDRTGFPSFTVNHFNGAITYSSEGFLDRNLDAINPDFVSLLRGAADRLTGTGSINLFVKGHFSPKRLPHNLILAMRIPSSLLNRL
jgi:chitin synthase